MNNVAYLFYMYVCGQLTLNFRGYRYYLEPVTSNYVLHHTLAPTCTHPGLKLKGYLRGVRGLSMN